MANKVVRRPKSIKGRFVKCSIEKCQNMKWLIPYREKNNKSKLFFCSEVCSHIGVGVYRKGYKHTEKTKEKIKEKRALQIIPKESYLKRDLKGEKHWNWKGGRITDSYGYVKVLSSNHPNKDRHGYMKEHRLVIEMYLGRYLTSKETVHHINEVKNDNRIENLYLFDSLRDHNIYHHKLRRKQTTPIVKSNILVS